MGAWSPRAINNNVENILKYFTKTKNKMQQSLSKHYDMFLKSTIVGKAIAIKTTAFGDNKELGMVNANNCKIITNYPLLSLTH